MAEDPKEGCRETEEPAGVTWREAENNCCHTFALPTYTTPYTGIITLTLTSFLISPHSFGEKSPNLRDLLSIPYFVSDRLGAALYHYDPPGKCLTFHRIQPSGASCRPLLLPPKRAQLQCCRGHAGCGGWSSTTFQTGYSWTLHGTGTPFSAEREG